ncbi:glucose/sorbosone family PQQ-dependent dehydrogenase [Streptomyces sp. ST1015]|uniref:glucose/sorbosone family PQQ-dependent dehydrogenase n=1 Tax=unclassified Streptomyces TaxID=2593676 RepID=UPI001CA7449E|nr:glucose/sorbosone family PQQ-dependent dehydrogenase [Streptomyces sp. ST1015]QZZ32363.1 quinoprotein glucose dehydrogenase [Streptomyces sp. ST1015]
MRKPPSALALAAVAALVCSCGTASAPGPGQRGATAANLADRAGFRVVTTGLGDPYEMIQGPDGHLWLTEKSGLRVTRVDPATGTKTTALDLTRRAVRAQGGKDGVLGLALHPDFGKKKGSDYVYLSYSSMDGSSMDGAKEAARIVRYTAKNGKLSGEYTVLSGLPAGDDHQAGRLRYGPDGKLYYSIGDQGANYLAHYCDPNQAQNLPTAAQVKKKDWSAYPGKILRMNPDGSIPHDNPELNGVRSHVYAYGMRNPNGMDFRGQELYTAENGPLTDDEFNRVDKGGNYGWPNVAGYQDDKAYVYSDWAKAEGGCRNLTFTPNPGEAPAQVPTSRERDFTKDMKAPLSTYGTTVATGHDFGVTPVCTDANTSYMCWPTMAPGGLKAAGDAFLVTSLKNGTVYRLTKDGTSFTQLHRSVNRYRDVALSPDGKTLYIATDSGGLVHGPGGTPTRKLANPGAILAVPYGK